MKKNKYFISVIAALSMTSEAQQLSNIGSHLSPTYFVNNEYLLPLTSVNNGQIVNFTSTENNITRFKKSQNNIAPSKESQKPLTLSASASSENGYTFDSDELVSDDGRYTYYRSNVQQIVYDNVTGMHIPLDFNTMVDGELVQFRANSLVTDISPNGRFLLFVPDYYDLSFNMIGDLELYESGVYIFDRVNLTVKKVRTTDFYDVSFINQSSHLKISNDGIFLIEGVGYCFNINNSSSFLYIKGSACNTIPQLFVRNLLNNNIKQITSGNTVIDPVTQGNYSYSYYAQTNDHATQISYTDFLPNDGNTEGTFVASAHPETLTL